MPRLPLGLIRRLVPGEVGEGLAREVESAYRRDLARRGALVAGLRCWREALAPGVWNLRRELGPGSTSSHRTTPIPRPGDPVLVRLFNDFRHAARALSKRPTFALTALLIIAVGIGTSTTIFTVVDHVLLRQLPYDDPDSLVSVDDASFSVPQYLAWKRGSPDVFSHFAAIEREGLNYSSAGTPVRVRGAAVTPEFFPALGVQPAMGRGFAPADFVPVPDVVLMSHGAWQSLLGGAPDVVGRSMLLNQRAHTVVGVLPEGFRPPEAVTGRQVDFWRPFDALNPAHSERWGNWYLQILGRLEAGTSLEAARTELGVMSERLVQANPFDFDPDALGAYRIGITPLHEATVGELGGTLYLLLGAVGLMLLNACANVASLLLARATDRHREVAVRAALGASRRHLFQHLFVEAMTLSLAGGLLGVALAYGGVGLFEAFEPGDLPLAGTVTLDWRILGFACLITVATGLVFGVAPAWRATRANLNDAIRDGSGTLSASAGKQRLRNGLVVVEVALAVVLTIGAGLLFSSFLRLTAVDPGFETDNVLRFRLGLETHEVAERLPIVEQMLERSRAIPGVESVGLALTAPFDLVGANRCCWFDSLVVDQDPDTEHRVIVNPVADGYFETLKAPLLSGRAIGPDDRDVDPVAMLTETTARQIFGRSDVIGEILHVDGGLDLRVVGVVGDIRHWGYTSDGAAQLYVSYRGFHQYFRHATFLVRGQRDDLAAELRRVARDLDPDAPLQGLTTMREQVASSVAAPRFYSGTFGLFSLVALVLAAGGIYGVLMFQVGQRSREMGIRMALGARGGTVVGMVVRDGLLLAAIGLALGLTAALGLARLLESQLYAVEAADPSTFLTVAVVLMVVAGAASYLPARRASRFDPLVALRAE